MLGDCLLNALNFGFNGSMFDKFWISATIQLSENCHGRILKCRTLIC